MSEVLLQTIVEKLESIEIALLKGNPDEDLAMQKALLQEIRSLQAETAKLPLQMKLSAEKMSELLKGISALNYELEPPKSEHIKHSHHLHKGIWIAVGLFIISLSFLFAWINCISTKKTFEANDIKYRFLKVNGNSPLLKLLYQTDSLYNLNNDSFTIQVVAKEQNFAREEKLLRLAGEKKKNAGGFINKARKYLSK